MALNLPGVPYRPDPGVPDYAGSLLGGLQGGTEAYFRAPKMAQQLLDMQLKNKINQPYASGAQRMFEADVGGREANRSHQELINKYLPREKETSIYHDQLINKYLPGQLEAKARAIELESKYPGLGKPGLIGQLASLRYMRDNPNIDVYGQREPTETERHIESYMPAITKALENKQYQGLPQTPQFSDNNPPEFAPSGMPKSLRYSDLMQQNLMRPQLNKNATPLEKAIAYRDSLPAEAEDWKAADSYVKKLSYGKQGSSESDKRAERKIEQADTRLKNATWTTKTAAQKAHDIALGQGAGIPADEVQKWEMQGNSLIDLLHNHGLTDEEINNIEPVYELTNSSQTLANQRAYQSRETEYLGNYITNNTGRYAFQLGGYPIDFISRALSGKSDEEQAKFLTARALSSEMTPVRLGLAGSKGTVHAIKQLAETTMLDSKIPRSLVSSKVWNMFQKELTKTLEESYHYGQKNIGGPRSKLKEKLQSDAKKSEKEAHDNHMVTVHFDNGDQERMSRAEAKKKGYL